MEIADRGFSLTSMQKTKRASGAAAGKENAREIYSWQEMTPLRPSEGSDYSLKEVAKETSIWHVGSGGTFKSGVISIPSGSFQQPFRDSQQMQLRAQIFVYGALRQGSVPDEACMAAAFGASDGGRSVWEPVWRICVERTQGQRSLPYRSETSVPPFSDDRSSEKLTQQGSHQNKVHVSPLGRESCKAITSPIINPVIPLPSPLWNIPTPSDRGQALSPLYSWKAPPAQSVPGHNASWTSQSPVPSHSIANPSPRTSGFEVSARSPLVETVLTPLKEPSAPVSSGTKHAPPRTIGPVEKLAPDKELSGSEINLTTSSAAVYGTDVDVLASGTPSVAGQKFRKGKKFKISEGSGQISLLDKAQREAISPSIINSHLSMPVVVSTPAGFASQSSVNNTVFDASPASTSVHLKMSENHDRNKVISLEDTFISVEEAERQAEDAAASAASVVVECQNLWSHLNMQKNSGVVRDTEEKRASSSMVLAAAVAVAKAAAAAAKIASSVALQAKFLSDESSTFRPLTTNLVMATPFVISAAKKMVQTASAASRHKENLDAIVKAAELAAVAVSQARNISFLADPIPLESVPRVSSEEGVISNKYIGQQSGENGIEGLQLKDMNSKCNDLSCCQEEILSQPVIGKSGSSERDEKETTLEINSRACDLPMSIAVAHESAIGSRNASSSEQDECEMTVGSSTKDIIKEGSFVEVLKDGSKRAWFSANVLSLKDGKAFLCYSHLTLEEGIENLKEWIDLETKVNDAPKIRIAHPITRMFPGGNRKRLRHAMEDFSWSAGDRVDAWVQDCWREGVVTEKDTRDDNSLIISFPLEWEAAVFKKWELRATLVWKDEKWVPWCSSEREWKKTSSQGDTPQEKRLKLGKHIAEGKKKDKMSKIIEFIEPERSNESRLQPLSPQVENLKNGNQVGQEDKTKLSKADQSNKDGPKAISRVPKCGKRKQQVEASEHNFKVKNSKTNESNDSVKFAKKALAQGTGSRGSKPGTRSDPKAVSQTRVAKGKGPSILSKTMPQNDNNLASGSTALDEDLSMENPIVFTSLAPPAEATSKKLITSKPKSEKENRRKPAYVGGRHSKVETRDKADNDNAGQAISEVVEPRRSDRVIRPTSKLLEGLQSSIMISKVPAVSHDNSRQCQHESMSKASKYPDGAQNGRKCWR